MLKTVHLSEETWRRLKRESVERGVTLREVVEGYCAPCVSGGVPVLSGARRRVCAPAQLSVGYRELTVEREE